MAGMLHGVDQVAGSVRCGWGVLGSQQMLFRLSEVYSVSVLLISLTAPLRSAEILLRLTLTLLCVRRRVRGAWSGRIALLFSDYAT